MRAAYYESNGPAREVLQVADIETPEPAPGEVRVRLRASGINPSDVKSRAGTTRRIAFPRVIPHSDGAGEIDRVGEGVPESRLGQRVWIWNAQWRRPFGTAAEAIVLPAIPFPIPTLEETDTEEKGGPAVLKMVAGFTGLTRPFNTLGVPALSLPCGFDRNGAPIGLQLVGRPFDEALLYRIGHAYQGATDFHARVPV